MRLIDADLLKNNIKTWAERIRDYRYGGECFFTEKNVIFAIDEMPTAGQPVEISTKCHKKPISWYQIYKRIGKQPMRKTTNTKVQVLVNGELRECALVFSNNGSDFHLEICN